MSMVQLSRIKSKKDTKARWTTNNPILLAGEIGVEIDTDNRVWMKIGDGITRYNVLPYMSGVARMRWNGTSLEVLNENGVWVASNLVGAIPNHEWNLTKIRFQTSATTWGEWKEIAPDHEWNLTPEKKELRFKKPDGTFGDFIDLSSFNYFFTDDDIGEVKEWIYPNNIPVDFLKLDGTVINKVDYPEFFSFLLQGAQILDTDSEYTLPIKEDKIIRIKNSRTELLKVIYDKLVAHNVLSDISDLKGLKAPLASPSLTGIPLAPTPTNGTNTTQIATTAFAYGLCSKDTTGYSKAPNGLIIQWGSVSVGSNVGATVTFPLAFPTACVSAVATLITSSNWDESWSVYSVSKTAMAVRNSNGGTLGFYWIAIGY